MGDATIYFDNAAAMVPDVEVLDFYRQVASQSFINQEASHLLGYTMRQNLKAAEEELSTAIANRNMSVAWADSGTTLFNMIGSLSCLAGGNVVLSPLEHPAVGASLQRSGAELRFLPVTKSGEINWAQGAKLLDKETRLVVLFHVQSELGLLNNIEAAREHILRHAPNARLVCDTIQSAGKLTLPAGVDIFTVSGHKIGALGAAALLYNHKTVNSNEFEQMRHRDYRIGRVEVAQALTLTFAAKLRAERRAQELTHVTQINQFLRQNLKATFSLEKTSPYILHLILSGYQTAIIMRMLSAYEIYTSSGSACVSESDKPSAALTALGYKRDDGYAGLRISLSPHSTLQEAEFFIAKLNKILKDY